jgi:cytochrome c peroxidase
MNTDPIEMGVAGREQEVLDRFRNDAEYPPLFRRAFPDDDDPVSIPNVVRALASYERTLISAGSDYDRWAYGARSDALDPRAREGARLFFSERLGCFRCHAGFNLSGPVVYDGSEPEEPRFHNTGLYDVDGQGTYPEPNTGVHRVTGSEVDMGRFRAPTLRNIALTAPYMHDGSVPTLEAVIDHYASGGRAGKTGRTDPMIAGFELTADERLQLVAFLEALTDEALRPPAR